MIPLMPIKRLIMPEVVNERRPEKKLVRRVFDSKSNETKCRSTFATFSARRCSHYDEIFVSSRPLDSVRDNIGHLDTI